MSITIELSDAQLNQIRLDNEAIVKRIGRLARRCLTPRRDFLYFAAFDGTCNDKDDLNGDRYCTNVGQLWAQYAGRRGVRTNLGGGYFPGLGTKGSPRRDTWMPTAVSAQVREVAKRAYDDLTTQAQAWFARGHEGNVVVVLCAFSRGVASAAIFSQMLWRNALPLDRAVQAPGTVNVACGVLFDPVATGVEGNLALAPTAARIVVIKALSEYRHFFKAVDYSNHADIVSTFGMYGNHCDIGGGYDNGIAALALEAATGYLRSCGLPLGKVPDERCCNAPRLGIHSEEYDDHGNRIWDVYHEDGFSFDDLRLYDDRVVVFPASRDDATGKRRFVLYDGEAVEV